MIYAYNVEVKDLYPALEETMALLKEEQAENEELNNAMKQIKIV